MEYGLLILGILILLLALGSYWDTTARIGRIERKLNALLAHHGVDPTLGLPLSDRVKQLARDPTRRFKRSKRIAKRRARDWRRPKKRSKRLSTASRPAQNQALYRIDTVPSR